MNLKNLMILVAALLLWTLGNAPLTSIPAGGEAMAQPSGASTPKPKIIFSGGPGDSFETAVIIKGAPNSQVGIAAEYYYLEKKFGQPKADWKLLRQKLLHKDGKHYDLMQIQLKDGAKKDIYFDITEFFGKL
ncbi:MAG: hypothetical protein Q8M54_08925 [Desulfobaccales bacterium]|nr:hypothetical protein [Desulfobaccales bacterium]